MNLFLAAVYTNSYRKGQNRYVKLTEREQELVQSVGNILESYHYVEGQKFVDAMREDSAKVFLDSGAFSAYSLGVEIDIDAYCKYIIENKDILRTDDGVVMASVLDGIGDPKKTWENQIYMEQHGATPLPCFHFGEDEAYLDWYVQRYPYITIGGLVGRKVEDVLQWLTRIWNRHMLDKAGRPKLKVHAFGVTTVRIMEAYPWYSVDSSSWIQAAAFGSIYTAKHGPIAVSSKSPSRHDMGRHLSTVSPIERAQLDKELAELGFHYDRLSEVYESRAAYNLHAYTELNAILNRHFEAQGGVLDCHRVQTLF